MRHSLTWPRRPLRRLLISQRITNAITKNEKESLASQRFTTSMLARLGVPCYKHAVLNSASPTPAWITPLKRRHTWLTRWLYLRAMLYEFRWTLGVLTGAMLLAAILFKITRHPDLQGNRPDIGIAIYCAWMALLAQPVFNPPARWYLAVIDAVYPIFGLILI